MNTCTLFIFLLLSLSFSLLHSRSFVFPRRRKPGAQYDTRHGGGRCMNASIRPTVYTGGGQPGLMNSNSVSGKIELTGKNVEIE